MSKQDGWSAVPREQWPAWGLPPDIWPALDAVRERDRAGVIYAYLAVRQALKAPSDPLVAKVAKAGQLFRKEVTSESQTARRASVVRLLKVGADVYTLATQLRGVDLRFESVSVEAMQAHLSRSTGQKAGRNAQGVYRTAARLACACGAFGDSDEEESYGKFKEAARPPRAARSSSKKQAARTRPRR